VPSCVPWSPLMYTAEIWSQEWWKAR